MRGETGRGNWEGKLGGETGRGNWEGKLGGETGRGNWERKMEVQLTKIIKVADKTSGRDKICRLLQYGSKFLYWLLEQKSLKPELIKKLKNLENTISTSRKSEPYLLKTTIKSFSVSLTPLGLLHCT